MLTSSLHGLLLYLMSRWTTWCTQNHRTMNAQISAVMTISWWNLLKAKKRFDRKKRRSHFCTAALDRSWNTNRGDSRWHTATRQICFTEWRESRLFLVPRNACHQILYLKIATTSCRNFWAMVAIGHVYGLYCKTDDFKSLVLATAGRVIK